MQNKHSYPDAQNDHSQSQTHLQSDPHPSFCHIENVIPSRKSMVGLGLLLSAHLNPRQYQVLLQVQHIIHHPAQQNVDEPKTNQYEDASEELCEWRYGGYVSVANCAHGNDAEVESIDDRVGFYAGELVPVEGVDDNSKSEIYEKQKKGLPDDNGAGIQRRLGNRGGLCFSVAHDRHGWGSSAAVELLPLWEIVFI